MSADKNYTSINELVAAVAEAKELPKKTVDEVIRGALEEITNSLKAGKEVRFVGFGTFALGERKATEGRNPRSGEKIKIPAAKTVRFKVSKTVKDAVNG